MLLLRAVNLGSTNKVSMPVLRERMAEAGFTDVRTYVQSGNIVAASKHRSEATVARDLHDLIQERFGVDTPVIVRMETLRRAAIYASRDRHVAERLVALVIGRIASVSRPGYPDAMAFFDAAYVIEVLKELQDFAPGSKVFWARDRAIVAIIRSYDARALMEQSAALRPKDGAIQLALALLLPPDEAEPHLRRARVIANGDEVLANNLARLRLQ